MTEPDRPATALALHRALDSVWRPPTGWRRLAAVNNNAIGLRFIITAFVFFLIGGILAMLIRAQLATPRSAFVGPETYNQIFTMHGTVMMFLFAIPMIDGLAMYLLPKLLGTRDLAFPRLSAYGYWCYLFGGSIMIVALVMGFAPDSGWFMYTPLSSNPYSPGINSDVWLIGITFVEIASIAAAVEIAVTILKMRAPGMSLDKMPLLAWYLLVTAIMILIGFPPLILGSILLEIERVVDWPLFDPTRGGDSLLWQHLFWLFGHPEVYIIFIPGAGIIATVLPVMARTTIVGYGWIVASVIALGFLSFGLWVHHMFATGIPHLGLAFFSAASTLVAIPTAIQFFAWFATLVKGRPELKLPMLYILGFFAVFLLGGLTGVMIAVVPFNWQSHDTHFIVAHLHYVLVGGFVFPLLAGAYYWLPHMTGRERVYGLGEGAFWLIFIGFNLTFFLMHLTGLRGMPRRIYTYPDDVGWTLLNLLSSVGGFLLTIGFALFLIDVILQARVGRKTRRNPWGAGTLEWALMSPSRGYNFPSLPTITTREPLHDRPDLANEVARGQGYLAHTRNGWRETLGVAMTTGRPDQIIILPGPTFLPLVTAIVTGVFFVGLLLKLYVVALLGAAGVFALGFYWAWTIGQRRDHGPLDIGRGESALPHTETAEAPGRWGMIFTLAADATLFGSLLFGYAFLWTIAPNWPPPVMIDGEWWSAAAGLAGLAVAALATRRSVKATMDGRLPAARAWLLAAAGGQLLAVLMLLRVSLALAPAPTGHAYAAASHVLVGYAILHGVIGAGVALFGWARIRAGFVSARRSLDLRVGSLWQDYAGATGAVVLLLLHGLPAVTQ